jgi:hypothetical protein
VRTCAPMQRERSQAAQTARVRVPMRSAGTEQPVVGREARNSRRGCGRAVFATPKSLKSREAQNVKSPLGQCSCRHLEACDTAHIPSSRFPSLKAFGRRPRCRVASPRWAVIRNPAHQRPSKAFRAHQKPFSFWIVASGKCRSPGSGQQGCHRQARTIRKVIYRHDRRTWWIVRSL